MPLPHQQRRSYGDLSSENFASFSGMNASWGLNGPDHLSTTEVSFPALDYNESWGGDTASIPIVTPSRKKINERESSWFNDEPPAKDGQRKTFKQKQLWLPKRLDRLGDDDVESIAESIAHNTSISLASNTADSSKYEGLPTKDVARGFVVEQKRMEVLEYSRRLLKGKSISEVKDGIVSEMKGLIATRATPHSVAPRRASIGGTSEHSHVSDWGSAHGTPRRKSLGFALGSLPDHSPIVPSPRRIVGDGIPRARNVSLPRVDHNYLKSHPSPRASPFGAKQRIGRTYSAESLSRLALTQGQAKASRRPSFHEDESEGTMRTTHTVDTFEQTSSPKKTRRSSIASRRVAPNDSSSVLTSKLHSSRRSSATVTTAMDDSFNFQESLADNSSGRYSKTKSFASEGSVSSRVRPSRRQSLTGHPSMANCSPTHQTNVSPTPTPLPGPELVLDRAAVPNRTQLMRSNSGSTIRSSNSSSGSSKVSSPRGVTRLPPTVPISQATTKTVELTPRRAPRRLSQHSSMGARAPSPATRTSAQRTQDGSGMTAIRQHRSARASSSSESFQEPSTTPRIRRPARRSSMI